MITSWITSWQYLEILLRSGPRGLPACHGGGGYRWRPLPGHHRHHWWTWDFLLEQSKYEEKHVYHGIVVSVVGSSWSPSSSLVNFLHQRWRTRGFLLKEANMRRNIELVAASNYWMLMHQTNSDFTSKEQHIQFQVWYAWCVRMRG